LGLLRLDTHFPRQRGDAGLPASWPMPVKLSVVPQATPQRVVHEPDAALLATFVAAARALQAQGVAAITTSCGFLARWQTELQASVEVPFIASALLKLPELVRPGVLTVDAAAFGAELLHACGAGPDTPVAGLAAGCHLQRTLLEDRPQLDPVVARADAVSAARRLVEQHPHIDSIVLECTNLPPYADAISAATRRPVHHLITLVRERWETLT
jgi:hypothetical protein